MFSVPCQNLGPQSGLHECCSAHGSPAVPVQRRPCATVTCTQYGLNCLMRLELLHRGSAFCLMRIRLDFLEEPRAGCPRRRLPQRPASLLNPWGADSEGGNGASRRMSALRTRLEQKTQSGDKLCSWVPAVVPIISVVQQRDFSHTTLGNTWFGKFNQKCGFLPWFLCGFQPLVSALVPPNLYISFLLIPRRSSAPGPLLGPTPGLTLDPTVPPLVSPLVPPRCLHPWFRPCT